MWLSESCSDSPYPFGLYYDKGPESWHGPGKKLQMHIILQYTWMQAALVHLPKRNKKHTYQIEGWIPHA